MTWSGKVLAISILTTLSCGKENSVTARPVVPNHPESTSATTSPASKTGSLTVVFQNQGTELGRISAEVARTDAERQKGLMYRKELGVENGMLFIFDREEVQTFWMKNTLLPLDMIFVNREMKVVGVVERALPLTTDPRTVGIPSLYVVETVAGYAKQHGIVAGSTVVFQ